MKMGSNFNQPVADPDTFREVIGQLQSLPLTVFQDFYAMTMKASSGSLDKIARSVKKTTAKHKHDLPLIKLATFGNQRSPIGDSLRWDANVIAVTGVEGDYDGGVMAPEEARDRLAQAGIEALVYTSPSHTPKKPRWRVLALFCCPLDPLERARMVSRLNGALGGVLHLESWTLSQSFYYGRVKGVPFRRYQTEGKRIDDLPELDAGAIGPSVKDARESTGEKCGESWEVVKSAVLVITNDGERDEENERTWWLRIIAAIKLESDGNPEGLELAHEWSARWPGNDSDKVQAAWDSFGTRKAGRMATGFTIMREAKKYGWVNPAIVEMFDDLGVDPEDTEQFRLDEDGVIRAFEAKHADDLRFNHDAGRWLLFDGNVWRPERTKLAHHFARDLSIRMAERDPKAKALRKVSVWEAVERGARTVRRFSTESKDWDQNPDLLGTPGGTVDLGTGELRRGNPDDHISRVTAAAPIPLGEFDPAQDCPRWLAFLEEALDGDADAIRFLQQWAGYSLTGDTREQVLLFVHGPGGSGKTTAINTMAAALGEYSIGVATSTLTAAKYDAHPEELARLDGPRMAYASETEKGRAWKENRIKQMTGGDTITARHMRQDSFDYVPQFKLVIVGNNQPSLSNVDEAFKRRFIILPFDHPPKSKDLDLPGKLRAEFPGILSWMVEGCLDWRENGLIIPEVSRVATEAYFENQDVFGQWIQECCELTGADTTANLWDSWFAFTQGHGEDPGSKRRTFPETLLQRGFKSIKDTKGIRGRGYLGITVKAQDFDDFDDIV